MRQMKHLDYLEAEAIYILRESAAQFSKLVSLFSGGKDSLTLLRLAEKVFRPFRFPFQILHIDTGHNFPETILFRDRTIKNLGEKLLVRRVMDTIASGRATDTAVSRNALQSVTFLEAMEEFKFQPHSRSRG